MNAYVVYCHPNPESFTAALRDRAVDALRTAGHEVRLSDLYADGFEPALSRAEWIDHLAPQHPHPEIETYRESLRWCDALVFVYPTWWSGQPAMLTGWLDRVLVRGVAWELPDGATRITGRLTNVSRLVIWLALYNIDRCSQLEREAFLDRVEQRMRRLWFSPTGLAGRRW
jgi:NAD(P)H dehydrogenase (quinone)